MSAVRAIYHDTTPADRLRKTVELIGQGIRSASVYPPLRLHAANVATRAKGHKNYLGQVKAIYDDFLKRWKYVRDIEGLETVATTGPAIWGLVAGAFNKNPKQKGHGDCDDATAYLGAAYKAIGLPVRIVTMSRAGEPAHQQSHVYPEVNIPGKGWIPTDPVAHPKPLGSAPPASARIIWSLFGHMLGTLKGGNMPEKKTPKRARPTSQKRGRPIKIWRRGPPSKRVTTLPKDAQMANIDLENMLQKQQQTIQQLSQISKLLHDTAMGVVRKIGSLGDTMQEFTPAEIRILKQLAQRELQKRGYRKPTVSKARKRPERKPKARPKPRPVTTPRAVAPVTRKPKPKPRPVTTPRAVAPRRPTAKPTRPREELTIHRPKEKKRPTMRPLGPPAMVPKTRAPITRRKPPKTRAPIVDIKRPTKSKVTKKRRPKGGKVSRVKKGDRMEPGPAHETPIASIEDLKRVQSEMETVRNKREERRTAFEEADQKSNQLFNMLSTVMKSMKDSRSGVTRSML